MSWWMIRKCPQHLIKFDTKMVLNFSLRSTRILSLSKSFLPEIVELPHYIWCVRLVKAYNKNHHYWLKLHYFVLKHIIYKLNCKAWMMPHNAKNWLFLIFRKWIEIRVFSLFCSVYRKITVFLRVKKFLDKTRSFDKTSLKVATNRSVRMKGQYKIMWCSSRRLSKSHLQRTWLMLILWWLILLSQAGRLWYCLIILYVECI